MQDTTPTQLRSWSDVKKEAIKYILAFVSASLLGYFGGYIQRREQAVRDAMALEKVQADNLAMAERERKSAEQREAMALDLREQTVVIRNLADQIRRIEEEHKDFRRYR
jgi:hypothetical protein